MNTPPDPVTLADWRRRVAELYQAVRQDPDYEAAWRRFRAGRDALFKDHPQTPLTAGQQAAFRTIPYYEYDPSWRLVGRLDQDVTPETRSIELPTEGVLNYTRVARVRFAYQGQESALSLYWVEGYGGGLFLPFRDASNSSRSYGGGRYLYDTIKGADLGVGLDEIVLDFNYAYNPSCAYHDGWVCPLPPAENRLSLAVTAGEQRYHPQN